MENKFEQQLSQLDIRLTERQKEQFHQYYELLVEWKIGRASCRERV